MSKMFKKTYPDDPVPQQQILTLKVVDQKDKHAPHFLELKINRLAIFFSFNTPIAFATRDGKNMVLRGLGHNVDIHAVKASQIIRIKFVEGVKAGVKASSCESMRSQAKFNDLLITEIKKETIHTSSEVMRKTFGVE